MPMAAARFLVEIGRKVRISTQQEAYAGGRGIALDTHTSVIANPILKSLNDSPIRRIRIYQHIHKP